MSSALSIASVTAVLKDMLDNRLIQQGVGSRLGDITVTALPPDRVPIGTEERPQINLFLYRIVPNTSWRNLPVHAAAGNGTQEIPPLALDLYYLLAAYGEQEYQAEILLGNAIQVMHETPLLTEEMIRNYLNPVRESEAAVLPSQIALRESRLIEATEPIQIHPEFISMDDSAKLWSALQAKYRPSVSYKVSLVLIEANE